jgi:hypothetical protein
MKRRLLFILLVFFILADGISVLLTPAPPEQPSFGHLSEKQGLQSAGERAAASLFRRFSSSSWLRRQTEPQDLVPQDALLMLEIADAAAAAKAFANSRFGIALSTAVWRQLGLSEDLHQRLSEVNVLAAHPLLQELFSRRAVLALLNPAQLPEDGGGRKFWLEHLLLIVQSGQSQAELTALLKPEEERTVWHQGVAVQAAELEEGGTVYAASVGGQLLLSPGLRPIQAGIDLFLHRLLWKRTGLSLNPDFVAGKESAAGKDDFFLHADLARFAAVFGLTAPVRSVGLFHRQDGRTDRFTASVRFPPEQPPGGWAGMPPVRNRSLSRMPARLLFHFWSNWLLPGCWLEAVPTNEDELTAADAWLKQKGSLGLSETLSLFGQEFSFLVSGINTDGLLPVPRISLLADITDPPKAERFLSRMTAGLPTRREVSSGVPVVSLQAANGLMQPSYAFADGLLFLADSRNQIEDILAADSAKLIGSPLFQAVNTGLDQPANLTLFIRPAELSEGMKGIAGWASPLLASDQGAMADQMLPLLLEGMKTVEAAGLRSLTKSGELLIEAAVLRTR